MAKEYIEREAAYEKCGWYNTVNGKSVCAVRKDELASIPAADVVEVVHGRWIERKSLHAEGGVSAKCSVCQKAVQYLGNPLKYCPNCGSRMDKDGE